MPSLPTLAVAMTALAANTLAAPAGPDVNIDIANFRINQVSVGKKILNGPLEMERTYAKYGKVAPAVVQTAAKVVESGSVSATPEQYDESYLSPVTVGKPGTTLMLDFDAGSSDLWVYSTLQPKAQHKGHSFYHPNASTTSQELSGQHWNIGYGDGSGASGVVYADTVVIGGVTATSQSVEAATSVSTSFVADKDNDGLLGLAWPKINSCTSQRCQPFMQNVKSNLPSKVFTVSLKYHAPGSYDFGFIDAAKYTGDITYSPVSRRNGFWEFTTAGYSVGSTNTSASNTSSSYTKNMDVIADTGTTLMYLPNDVVSNYYAQIPGSQDSQSVGAFVFPCNATLPSLALNIKGTNFTVPGRNFNYAPVTEGSDTCYGGLQSSDFLGINILGDVFLKSVFAVFDVGKVRIGFAEQA